MAEMLKATKLARRVAILYQAAPPPAIDGQKKVAKEGGYSDSGADIGYALSTHGIDVVTPKPSPSPLKPFDWVFPDTTEGITSALQSGANVLYANTVLFEGHPIEAFVKKTPMVGQDPNDMNFGDDKFKMNRYLKSLGLPVATSWLLGNTSSAEVSASNAPTEFPVIVKPIRGRGSQGVSLAHSREDLITKSNALLNSGKWGDVVILEEYLGGDEITITVMPPASPHPDGSFGTGHWAFRPVKRVDQVDGVMPYNGVVPVTANSKAISASDLAKPEMQAIVAACCKAGDIINSKGMLRIDCRQQADGSYKIFDVNMKPNITGPGRPGRDNQDSLCGIAALGDGVAYPDLLKTILASAWTK